MEKMPSFKNGSRETKEGEPNIVYIYALTSPNVAEFITHQGFGVTNFQDGDEQRTDFVWEGFLDSGDGHKALARNTLNSPEALGLNFAVNYRSVPKGAGYSLRFDIPSELDRSWREHRNSRPLSAEERERFIAAFQDSNRSS
jgi:hypothetical protein